MNSSTTVLRVGLLPPVKQFPITGTIVQAERGQWERLSRSVLTEALKFPADCTKSAPLRRLRASAVCSEQQGPCPGLRAGLGLRGAAGQLAPEPGLDSFQPVGSGIPSGQPPQEAMLYTHTPQGVRGEPHAHPYDPWAGQGWAALGQNRASPSPTPHPYP